MMRNTFNLPSIEGYLCADISNDAKLPRASFICLQPNEMLRVLTPVLALDELDQNLLARGPFFDARLYLLGR